MELSVNLSIKKMKALRIQASITLASHVSTCMCISNTVSILCCFVIFLKDLDDRRVKFSSPG